jgi:hypothetical protein
MKGTGEARASTVSVAFQKFLDDGLLELLRQAEEHHKWREQRYWNKDCDFTYKLHLDMMRQLYLSHAGKRKTDAKKFTTKIFMTPSEFRAFW